MDKIKKTIRYNSLLKIYGNLLSKTQYAFADAYFSYDLEKNEKILDLIAKAKDASGEEKVKLLEEVERIIYSYGI